MNRAGILRGGRPVFGGRRVLKEWPCLGNSSFLGKIRASSGSGRPEGITRGYFARPTVFADVRNEMTIAREEIFGPVLCIIPTLRR